MDRNKTTLERAFQLAESGQYENLTDIRAQLKSEGYSLRQMEGRALNKQLIQIMQKARGKASAAPFPSQK